MPEVSSRWKTPFFTIWTGQQVSLIGSSLVQFAIVWWLTKTTGSATVLATATLVAMLPQIVIGPFSGALVDRFSRRWVMILSDGATALSSVVLAYLFWIGTVQIWQVYLILAVRAIGGGFQWPAMSASTALMVPERHLTRVAGLTQTMQGVTNIISPPLGAILLALLPMYGIISIDVVTAAAAIGPLFFIPIPQPARSATAGTGVRAYLGEIREGFRYVWRWKGLRYIIGIAAFINFAVQPAFSLLPLLVRKHFSGGALQLSWLETAFGIGVVVGGLALSVWGGFRRRVHTSLAGIIGMGVGIAMMGFLPASGLFIGIGALFVVGMMNPLANGPLEALLQATIAPGMQGRVLALLGSLVTAMSPLSLALAGPVSDIIGIQFWYLVGGITMIVLGGAAFLSPTIMRIEDAVAVPTAMAAEEEISG